MTAIHLRPGANPDMLPVPRKLKDLHHLIGGEVAALGPWLAEYPQVFAWANPEAKVLGLRANMVWKLVGDWAAGPLLFVAEDDRGGTRGLTAAERAAVLSLIQVDRAPRA